MKRNPNVEIAERFASLPRDKQKVFLKLLRERGIDFARLPIVRRKDATINMASYAQARQWFLWQSDPHGTQYHIRGALMLEGTLVTDALDRSVTTMLQRHPAVRSTFFLNEKGELQFRVGNAGDLCLQRFDMSDIPSGSPLKVRDAAMSFSLQPFDMQRGPLLRVALFRERADRHVLVLSAHHSIADGWSLQIIMDELKSEYQSIITGRAHNPEALQIDYADYAAWQRNWLEAGERQRQLSYWMAYLGDSHPVMQIPTSVPRRTEASYTAAKHRLALPIELLERLRRSADENGMTMFTVLLAGLQVLLYRYSNQQDVRIGVPVANRQRSEVQGVVGLFINTQVLRCVFSREMTLAQVLQRASESIIGGRAHQDLPFEDVVEALRPAREPGVNPLFQVLVNHQHEGDQPYRDLAGLNVCPYDLGTHAAQFELTFDITEHSRSNVAVTINFVEELYAQSFVARMGGHYLSVLARIVDEPDERVARVDFLTVPEQAVLTTWGRGEDAIFSEQSVHTLFEQRASAFPNAVAVVFDSKTITYGELNDRANQLAHYLAATGADLETRVGISMTRSFELIVSVLAVLKAGGAFVPLDPDSPEDRLAFMIAQSGVRTVLTQSWLLDRMAKHANLCLVPVDELALAAQSTRRLEVDVHGSNLAYVIYTSGSTGQPKGVSISHHSLSICMGWMRDAFNVSERDTILHKASFSFDVSMWEIFLPLTAGARLVVANPGDQMDPAQIASLISEHDVTVMNFVPSMLNAFLADKNVAKNTRLRHIMCGGEAMPVGLQNEALERLPGLSLENLYGPTETTIHVTKWTCRGDGLPTVPIGQPISQTQAYVLGSELEPISAGLIGELYIGGALLARGYLNRSALTSDKFVADPFGANGGRLYRTGDMVRWNEAGQLEYLGRIDQQVKIRGRRIELAEVETRLLSHSIVEEAVVVAANSASGARLVAYVTCSTQGVDPRSLRKWCAGFLPSYMVPDVVVTLDVMPLNVNGKIDRNALPAAVVEVSEYEAPRGGIEQEMAAIWAEELGVNRVGRNSNFFELGGHSLLALRVLGKLNAKWPELALTVQRLFAEPTISAIANGILSQEKILKLNACVLDKAPLLILHDGWGSILDYAGLAKSLEGTCPVYGVSFDATDSDTRAPQTLVDLAAQHCNAILRMDLPGPYRVAGWSLGGTLALLVASMLEQRGKPIEVVYAIDPFMPGEPDLELPTLQQQLRQFLAILIPASSRAEFDGDLGLSTDLANADDDASVLALITNVVVRLRAADLHEYAALGPEGLMAMFKTARALQRAAMAPCEPAVTQAPVKVWWSNAVTLFDKKRFSAWSSSRRVTERHVDVDHLSIVRCQEVVTSMQAAFR